MKLIDIENAIAKYLTLRIMNVTKNKNRKKVKKKLIKVMTDNDLSVGELVLLKEGFIEALQIKSGVKKGIPASELWKN